MKPLKHISVARVVLTSFALLTSVACSSSPPQDENSELGVEEGEIPVASTDEVPTDLGTPTEPAGSDPYGLIAQAPDQLETTASTTVEEKTVAQDEAVEPVVQRAKKRRASRQKRILSQDTAPAPAAEPAPPVEQPVAEVAPPAPVEPPPPPPPAYAPPPVEQQPVADIPVEAPVAFYQHKFFIPGVIAALIGLFFLFRRRR